MNEEVVYFEVDNWFAGRNYPDAEPWLSWMNPDHKIVFRSDEFAKENKLYVVASFVDMSQNFCITATKKWVEENCPELLTKYERFLRHCEEGEEVPKAHLNGYFIKYGDGDFRVEWDE